MNNVVGGQVAHALGNLQDNIEAIAAIEVLKFKVDYKLLKLISDESRLRRYSCLYLACKNTQISHSRVFLRVLLLSLDKFRMFWTPSVVLISSA
jgi:hypothetical protein